jgi:hypothetical protein
MTVEIAGICRDHSFETAEEVCRRCGAEFCELCLVFPFGASKPLCKECAMAVGGVRSHVSRPPMARKDIRRKVKAFEAHRRNRAVVTAQGDDVEVTDPMLHDPLVPTDDDLERVPASVPATDTATDGTDDLPAVAVTPPPVEEPASGVAPPIDWNQPFG